MVLQCVSERGRMQYVVRSTIRVRDAEPSRANLRKVQALPERRSAHCVSRRTERAGWGNRMAVIVSVSRHLM